MNTRSVLVIDDERNIRRSLEMILNGEGYAASCAASGEEALEMLEKSAYDVALLDIVLPGINGIDALQDNVLNRRNGLDIKVGTLS